MYIFGTTMDNPNEQLVKHFFPSGFRVMIVDSDFLSLEIAEDLFLCCNYKVSLFDNPKTALSVLREHPGEFDLVLAELYMPEMDGLELLQIVKSELKIHVVLMSEEADMDIKMNTITKGAASFLDKPLDMVLVKTIWKNADWENILKEKKAPVRGSGSPTMVESRNNNMNQNKRMTRTMSKKQKNGITIEENINDKGNKEKTNYGQDAHHGKRQCTKKKCLSWTPFLELLFQNAVQTLGPDTLPSEILKLMNVEGVEMDHVASHLQEYQIWKKKQALVIQGSCQKNNKITSQVFQNQPQPQTHLNRAQPQQHLNVPSINFSDFNPWPCTNMPQYPPYKQQSISVDSAIAHNPYLIPINNNRGMSMRQLGLDNQKMKTNVPRQLHQKQSTQLQDVKQVPDMNDAKVGFDTNMVSVNKYGPTNNIGGVANNNILLQNNQMVIRSSTTPQLQIIEEWNASKNEEHVNVFPFHGINAPIPAHWA